MRKIILKHFLSPGDVLMLTAVVRDLHLLYPGQFQTDVRTPCPALWENNPNITPLDEDDPDVEIIDAEYPLIHRSGDLPYHFIHSFHHDLSKKLGIDLWPQAFKGDIRLSDEEKQWMSQVDEVTGMSGTRFWIIVAGGKKDFTAKWWDPARSQAVVDHFQDRVLFAQCGAAYDDHHHTPLRGVIDLVGKTDLRQMVRLMHHADGVICPVTMFMHLAAAVETKQGRSKNRPCVVVAGGREPAQWEAYPHHQYLHRNGCLPCCDNGGCWKSRVVPLGDGEPQDDSLCFYPVKTAAGAVIPKCLDMITADHVIDAVEQYLKYDTFAWRVFNSYHGPTL